MYVSNTKGAQRALPDDALQTPHALVSECFYAVCGYSVQSFEHAIAEGYVPMPGGHRVGICGTAVRAEFFSVKNITGLNLRVARGKIRQCPPVLQAALQDTPVGLLIAGAPGSGKTTLLRAVLSQLSAQGKKVAVVDERMELLPVAATGFALVPPLHCDVLSGYPKHVGMQHALRSLGPDVLVCDEIGALKEVAAVEQAANAGVGIVATMHAQTVHELARRPQFQALLRTGAFTHVALLAQAGAPGQVTGVYDAETFT
jgi:stage III sporulation protein AA